MQNIVAKTERVFIYAPDPIQQTIRSFGCLPHGWHYGDGAPAAPDLIALALASVGRLKALGAESLEAFPNLDGGILVSAYRGSVCVDLIIHPGDKVSLLVEDDDTEIFEKEDLTLFEALRTVGEKKWLSDPSSAFLIQSTTVINKSDLSLQYLVNQESTTAYLSYFNAVLTNLKFQYVTISGSTILQQLVETPLYSFDSMTTNYPGGALS